MATFTKSAAFIRAFNKLEPAQKAAALQMAADFTEDLNNGVAPRATLRVKPVQALKDVFEITWAYDGRAMFKYGDEVRPGHRHIDWLHIGTHKILP